MMLITAIVGPSRVDPVKRALALFGVRGLTLTRVFVPAGADAPVEVYRGERLTAYLAPRVRLDILCANVDAPDLAHVIDRAVAGHEVEIWVTQVQHLIRIRTGEVGLDAL
jgi:nitrogen regulatory protein PII